MASVSMFALAETPGLDTPGGLAFRNPFSAGRLSDLDQSSLPWSAHNFSTSSSSTVNPYFFPHSSAIPPPEDDILVSAAAAAAASASPVDSDPYSAADPFTHRQGVVFSSSSIDPASTVVNSSSPHSQQVFDNSLPLTLDLSHPASVGALGIDSTQSDNAAAAAGLLPMLCMPDDIRAPGSANSPSNSALPLYARRRKRSRNSFASDRGDSCSPQSSTSHSTVASSFLDDSGSPHDPQYALKDEHSVASYSPRLVDDHSFDLLFDSMTHTHDGLVRLQQNNPQDQMSHMHSKPRMRASMGDLAGGASLLHDLDDVLAHQPHASSASDIELSSRDRHDSPCDSDSGSDSALATAASYTALPSKDAKSLMSTFSSRTSAGSQKKHKCPVCNKRFTRPSSLQTHIFSHTGEKPFQCDHDSCGRRFSVVSNLRRHKRIHRGISK